MSRKNKMSPKLRELANYFIVQSCETGRPLTHKKLQKLVYYAQAWNLVFNKEKLFEENIEAWIHGPAIPILYSEYKKYGRLPINELDKDVKFNENAFSEAELEVMHDVWFVYGKFDGDYLEILSHSEDPWIMARGEAEVDENSKAVIDIDIMKIFYTNKNNALA